jgi:hypothetical protein
MVSGVRLQTLFLQNARYFIVTVAEVDLRRPPEDRAAVDEAGFASLRQQLGQTRQHHQARMPRSSIPSTSRRSRRNCGGRSSRYI